MTEYTESVSGFKLEGDWADIVAHGEMVAKALNDIDEVDEDFLEELDEYNEWRPKAEENIQKDIAEKTAEKASIDENEVEEETESPKEEVKEAGKHIKEGAEEDESVTKIASSVVFLARALSVFARQSMRHSEEMVYENVMTVLSPYYFDNELVSANINDIDDAHYTLEININDDELKELVSDKLRTYQDAGSWRIVTPMRTDIVEDVEGVEIPENQKEEEEDITAQTQ